MANEGPTKSDILAIFKRQRNIPTNKQCFDCGAQNPTWASVTYGVFLCIDCSATHRSLGVHVTFIRSTQLDTSWTWLQLRAMQVGGNAAAMAFFRQHGCTTNESQQKYHSRAAQMYREKLHTICLKAMKLHGTKLHLDTASDAGSPQTKEVDFFKEHESQPAAVVMDNSSEMTLFTAEPTPPLAITNGNSNSNGNSNGTKIEDNGEGPSVDVAISMSPTEAQMHAEPRKATIGGRKPPSAKKGLGGKKGLGAQRVKANFSDIETAAVQKDKEKEQMAEYRAQQESKSQEEEQKRMVSMKLAYKDLGLEEKKRGDKLKNMDPQKAAQAERLGMGFGGSKGVSHSSMTDMHTIEQQKPSANSTTTNTFERYNNKDYDEFEIVGFNSGPPKYSENPFGLKKEEKYSSNWGNGSSSSSSSNNKSSSWTDTSERFDSKQDSITSIDSVAKSKDSPDRGRSRKNYDVSDGTDAQKKFGSAKSISSDQYFGGNRDPDLETKQNLSKFEGSSSISSADFFGEKRSGSSQGSNYDQSGPDLADIKEGVKQGVTKVAGKLSSLANGVISSIQDHY